MALHNALMDSRLFEQDLRQSLNDATTFEERFRYVLAPRFVSSVIISGQIVTSYAPFSAFLDNVPCNF